MKLHSWKLKQIFEKGKKEKQKIKRVAMTERERERRENGGKEMKEIVHARRELIIRA